MPNFRVLSAVLAAILFTQPALATRVWGDGKLLCSATSPNVDCRQKPVDSNQCPEPRQLCVGRTPLDEKKRPECNCERNPSRLDYGREQPGYIPIPRSLPSH